MNVLVIIRAGRRHKHGYYKLWIGDSLYIVQTITCIKRAVAAADTKSTTTNLVSYTELACDRDWYRKQ